MLGTITITFLIREVLAISLSKYKLQNIFSSRLLLYIIHEYQKLTYISSNSARRRNVFKTTAE